MNRLRLLVVLAALVIGVGACGGDGDDGGGSGSGSGEAGGTEPADVITIKGSAFSGVETVADGATIEVRNDDGFPHTFTPDNDGDFQSAALEGGTSATIEMPGPGTYGYHCNIHPSMTGEITVEG
jgi:plastocyanin